MTGRITRACQTRDSLLCIGRLHDPAPDCDLRVTHAGYDSALWMQADEGFDYSLHLLVGRTFQR